MMTKTLVSVGLLVASFQGLDPAVAGEGGAMKGFEHFLSEFVSAWDARDLGRLGEVQLPEVGLWVIYEPGVSSIPHRFPSISDALNQSDHRYGYLDATGFQDCELKPGPRPQCGGAGDLEPLCRYGESMPDFLKIFDSYLKSQAGSPEDMARVQEEQERLRNAVGENLYFVSDGDWGGVFYFIRTEGGWKLVVVDLSDCSA